MYAYFSYILQVDPGMNDFHFWPFSLHVDVRKLGWESLKTLHANLLDIYWNAWNIVKCVAMAVELKASENFNRFNSQMCIAR